MDGNRIIVDWLKKNKLTYSNVNDIFELEVGSIGFHIQPEFNDEKIYAMHIFFNTEDSWDNLYERLIFSDDAPNKDIEGY